MEFYIKPFIYIIISLFLLWQLLKWVIPFLFNALMSYIQGIVLESENTSPNREQAFDYLNYLKTLKHKNSTKETYPEYADFEEID